MHCKHLICIIKSSDALPLTSHNIHYRPNSIFMVQWSSFQFSLSVFFVYLDMSVWSDAQTDDTFLHIFLHLLNKNEYIHIKHELKTNSLILNSEKDIDTDNFMSFCIYFFKPHSFASQCSMKIFYVYVPECYRLSKIKDKNGMNIH